MALNSHDTSAQPNCAMNHALICPLRMPTHVSPRNVIHHTINTINSAGRIDGIDRTARSIVVLDNPFPRIAIAPVIVKPASINTTTARIAEPISVHTVDSGVIRNAQ
jgi:hypothetical protein